MAEGNTQYAIRNTNWFPETAVLLIAAVFRIINLQDVPPGLSQDEVLNADIVSFIRQGQHAFFFREGFGHEPLYHYWSVPFQVLLGDNFLSIRLPALFLGMLLVAAVMRWARRDFGRVTAVTAGLLTAVSWWPVIFSRIGIRPIMEPLLLVGMAWFWQKKPVVAGLFLGLSLYTYTGARVVFLIPILYGLVQLVAAPDKVARWQAARSSAVILGVALLVYLPMQLTLWADPTLQQRINQLAGPLDAWRQGDWRPIGQSALLTLGVFSFTGDPRWTYTWPGWPLFDWVTAVFFYAGLIITLIRIRQPKYTLLLVWLAVTLLPGAITPQAPSIIRLIGAVPVVYIIVGLAVSVIGNRLSAIGKRNTDHRLPITVYGLLLTLFLITAGRTIQYGFIRWPQAVETRLNHYQTTFLDMARYWQQNPAERLVITDPFFEPIDAASFRRDLGFENDARWVQAGPEVAGALVFPQSDGGYGRLYVPEYAPVNPLLLKATAIAAEPLYRSPGNPSFAVYDLPAQPEIPLLPQPITFAGKISLIGYEILMDVPEDVIPLLTYWRVEEPLPANLKSFVHLTTRDGELLTQFDGLDVAPTRLMPGDVFIQYQPVPRPADLPENYLLQLGLYTSDNNQRLLHDGEPADRILIVP